MIQDNKAFEVEFSSSDTKNPQKLAITHSDETYAFELNGKSISVINNGDNSWSLVSGQLEQLTVNLIGDAIERYYKEKGW